MKKECYITESNQTDTAGNPTKILICYCGTTACTKGLSSNYSFPSDFSRIKEVTKDPDCDCEYEYTLTDKGMCKKCEDRFYKDVFKSNLLQ